MYIVFPYMSLLYSSGFIKDSVNNIMQTDWIKNIDI